MRALKLTSIVIYDSEYGNTEMIAEVIAESLHTTALPVRSVRQRDLSGIDLIVVGSPTQGGRPTTAIQMFLMRISPGALKGTSVAAFDTRLEKDDHGMFLRILMHVIGFAAPRIQKLLEFKGGKRIIEPGGFIVRGKEGPLIKGEIEKAGEWVETIKHTLLT